MAACMVAAAALRWLVARSALARPCALKACTVAAAALRWLVGGSANQPRIRDARAEGAVTRLQEEAEEGRDDALEEAIKAEGRADHEGHDDGLDRGDDTARLCALKACTVAAAALRWLMVRGVLARPCTPRSAWLLLLRCAGSSAEARTGPAPGMRGRRGSSPDCTKGQKKAERMPWKMPSRPKVVLILKTTMRTLIVETTLQGPMR